MIEKRRMEGREGREDAEKEGDVRRKRRERGKEMDAVDSQGDKNIDKYNVG